MICNKLKNKFLGIAAHDLRGPIGGIIGLSELLMHKSDEYMTAEQEECLKMIHTTSFGMMDLLNDLLDISMIESGKLELHPEMASVIKLVENQVKINRVVAGKKDISVHTDLAELSDIMIDTKRIVQVFENLMSNAIKFSPKGSDIYVTVIQENNMIKVSIKDQGPGISEDEQSRLFREFQRLSPRPTGGEPSTGLGLAIAKKITDAHNGVMEFESRPSFGSIFSFKIPIQR